MRLLVVVAAPPWISRRWRPYSRTAPHPPGPGLGEQAPSVKISTIPLPACPGGRRGPGDSRSPSADVDSGVSATSGSRFDRWQCVPSAGSCSHHQRRREPGRDAHPVRGRRAGGRPVAGPGARGRPDRRRDPGPVEHGGGRLPRRRAGHRGGVPRRLVPHRRPGRDAPGRLHRADRPEQGRDYQRRRERRVRRSGEGPRGPPGGAGGRRGGRARGGARAWPASRPRARSRAGSPPGPGWGRVRWPGTRPHG
jgi:translation initiation factor IF-2